METFGNVEACSGKEIAGLLRKIMIMRTIMIMLADSRVANWRQVGRS